MESKESKDLLKLEEELREQVIGQILRPGCGQGFAVPVRISKIPSVPSVPSCSFPHWCW